mmetsp:Transcript_20632/g.26755  ORF Transcript_20632/g.26755 Transcript_20632/m.26755 type:complete len:724 (+) Transcript_20632:103-2274(+)
MSNNLHVQNDSTSPNVILRQCQICLSKFQQGDLVHSICGEECSGSFCKQCAGQYFTSLVKAGYDGSCPRMKCPSCPQRNAKVGVWKPLVPESIFTLFEQRATLLLSIQCGSCHQRKNIMELPSESEIELAQSKHQDPFITSLMSDYVANRVDPNGALRKLYEKYDSQFKNEDHWEIFMKPLLWCILDAERRANLHLRYIRDFPKVKTKCCESIHCFRCRISGFHDNSSCDEFQAMKMQNSENFVEEMLTCSQCGIFLVKGDGCSSVSCVCGHSFDWRERASEFKIISFESKYGDEVAKMAARILYFWFDDFEPNYLNLKLEHHNEPDHCPFTRDEMKVALLWLSRNESQKLLGRAELWAEMHPHYTSQKAKYYSCSCRSSCRDVKLAKAWLQTHPEVQEEETQRAIKVSKAFNRVFSLGELAVMRTKCQQHRQGLHSEVQKILSPHFLSASFDFIHKLQVIHRVNDEKRRRFLGNPPKNAADSARDAVLKTIKQRSFFINHFPIKTLDKAASIIKCFESSIFAENDTLSPPHPFSKTPNPSNLCLHEHQAIISQLKRKEKRRLTRKILMDYLSSCQMCQVDTPLLKCIHQFCGPFCSQTQTVCKDCAERSWVEFFAAVETSLKSSLFPTLANCPFCQRSLCYKEVSGRCPPHVQHSFEAKKEKAQNLYMAAKTFVHSRRFQILSLMYKDTRSYRDAFNGRESHLSFLKLYLKSNHKLPSFSTS